MGGTGRSSGAQFREQKASALVAAPLVRLVFVVRDLDAALHLGFVLGGTRVGLALLIVVSGPSALETCETRAAGVSHA